MTSEELRNNDEVGSDQASDQPNDDAAWIKGVLVPGEWVSKAEAAVRLKKSERTIETYIEKGTITNRLKDGKREIFFKTTSPKMVGIDPKSSENGSDQNKNESEFIPNSSEKLLNFLQKDSDRLSEELRKSQEECEILRNKLSEALQRIARLEGEATGKDKLIQEKADTIAAKQQSIDAIQGAIHLLESKQQTINLLPEAKMEEKKRFWEIWK